MRDAAVGKLQVTSERAGAAIVVRAEGEVDLDNSDRLASALRPGPGDGEARVILDLVGVPFMDSSGLKTLLFASADLGDRLSLVLSPGAPVERLLELAEVRDRFEVHTSVEDATGAPPGSTV